MRFLDEKGRVFGKISVIDLVVVLVLVVAGAWFAYAKFGRNLEADVAARQQPIEYTIIVPTLRPTTAEALAMGGSVFEFKTGANIGTIRGVKTEPCEVWTIIGDGTWLKVKDDGKVDAYVTVSSTARVGEDTITVNGVEVRVGLSLGIKTKWAQVNGHILTMELPEGGPSR